jgi:isopentenyl-diphosphate delta-isomerase
MAEIASWRFISVAALEDELATNPDQFTPWFKLEWAHIKDNYLDRIMAGS